MDAASKSTSVAIKVCLSLRAMNQHFQADSRGQDGMAKYGKAEVIKRHQAALDAFKAEARVHKPERCTRTNCNAKLQFRWDSMLQELEISPAKFTTSQEVYTYAVHRNANAVDCGMCAADFRATVRTCLAVLQERSKYVKGIPTLTLEL